jgi:hypothetical protein
MSRTSKRHPRASGPAASPPDNRVQSDRFIAKAQEIQASAGPEIFERCFAKLLSARSLILSPREGESDRADSPAEGRHVRSLTVSGPYFHSTLAKAEGLWKMLPECRADRESAEAWRISSVRPGGRFVRLSSKQRRYLVAKGGRL